MKSCWILKALKSRGISELLLTSDRLDTLERGGVDGGMQATCPHAHAHVHVNTLTPWTLSAIRAVKLQKVNRRHMQDLRALQVSETWVATITWGHITFTNVLQPSSPTMVMDFWTGWYDVWGELHHVLPPEGKAVCQSLDEETLFSNFTL